MELDSLQVVLDLDQGEQTQQPAYDLASMPGFRFQPTEEELVGFYLRNMVTGNRPEVEVINVLNLYHYEPWELPAMALMQGDREWLFFCPRDKKYPNGARPNRVTASGYWKATGKDRPVCRAHDARCIGLKKTLVFYLGKAPTGRKTEWIMNEYRLSPTTEQPNPICRHPNSRATDDQREVALCRIYKKPFQINLISTTNPDFADNFMTGDPSESSSPKRMKLPPRDNSYRDMEMDTGSTSAAWTSQEVINVVELEPDLSSNLSHYKCPGIIPVSGYLGAQLVEEEAAFRNAPAVVPDFSDRFRASDHGFMRNGGGESTQVVDRLNWSDCLANITQAAGEAVGVNRGPSVNLCPSIASIDRLLKASTWSRLPPAPNLEYASAKLDGGDTEMEGSSSLVWN